MKGNWLTAIRRHDDLTDRTGIVRLENERRGIWHGIGQDVVYVELVLFQDQSLEQLLHGGALVRVGVQDRIAAKHKRACLIDLRTRRSFRSLAAGV